MSRIIFVFLIAVASVSSRTLTEILCGQTGEECSRREPTRAVPFFRSLRGHVRHKTQDLTSPSAQELRRWENYELNEPGTGLHPDSAGVGANGVPYGPGLGDVEIRSGLGIGYGVGDLGIRRDFGLFMGGSGRSGGQAFGWGNGDQRRTGAAPWFWP